MDGIGGKPAWAWIFSMFLLLILVLAKMLRHSSVLEGLATFLAGVASFWIIQDFPDNAKFLTEAERTVVIRRLQGDAQFSAAGENLRFKYIWAALKDWKTWVGSMFDLVLFSAISL